MPSLHNFLFLVGGFKGHVNLSEKKVIPRKKLISFAFLSDSLRERAQVEQLVRYIVEEAPEDAEKKRTFK